MSGHEQNPFSLSDNQIAGQPHCAADQLIDAKAIDMIHPDLATSGGLLETKKIGDYAEKRGNPMAMYFAGSPISMMANVYCAAAIENFVALEHHGLDVNGWEDLVTGTKPIVEKGFVRIPEKPALEDLLT